nr:metallophosphoesterase [Deltaproteobacteria bacterium]
MRGYHPIELSQLKTDTPRLHLLVVVLLIALLSTVDEGKAQSQPKETQAFTLERIVPLAQFSGLSEGNYACQQFRKPIVVDAKLDDWEGVEPIRLGGLSSDISARAYLGWDLENLYFACDVTDNLLDQSEEMAKVEHGDHLRLDFDLRNDGATPPRMDDQRYLVALSAKHGPLTQLYFRGAKNVKKPVEEAEVAAVQKEDGSGYIVETILPKEVLQLFAPLAQVNCGFRLTVIDFDEGKTGNWLSTSGSGNVDDWGELLFVPKLDGIEEFVGQIFVSRSPLKQNKPLKAELAILSPYIVYNATFKAQLTGSEGTLETDIENFGLLEGLNRFRLAWDTNSLNDGDYVIQIAVESQERQLLSFSSRQLTKGIKKSAKGAITRPVSLSIQLKWLNPYIAKYTVENVISRIQEVPYLPEKGFRFVVFGDSKGNNTLFKTIAENINIEKPLFVIGLGDLVKNGNAEGYLDFLKILEEHADYNFLPVIGNHDIGHKKKEFIHLFGRLNYYFDYGDCRFVILDNVEDKLTKKQLAWADEKLTEAYALRKFVFMHIPPKTIEKWAWHSFNKGSDEFVELMKEHRVDEVFMGHIHAYSTDERDGVHYTITGGGGASLHRRFGPEGNVHNYVVVDVNKDGVQRQVVRLGYYFVKGPVGNPYYAWATIPDTEIPNSVAAVERMDSNWKYTTYFPSLDGWFTDEYDAAAWSEGQAPFGYAGKKNIKTKLVEGCDYYFRKHFDIQDTAQFESVIVRVASADAAMVYLNGELIDKDPEWNGSKGHESAYWNRQVFLKPDAIRQGSNLIAVMLKDHNPSSKTYLDIEVLLA